MASLLDDTTIAKSNGGHVTLLIPTFVDVVAAGDDDDDGTVFFSSEVVVAMVVMVLAFVWRRRSLRNDCNKS
jgi:hypothetical protein